MPAEIFLGELSIRISYTCPPVFLMGSRFSFAWGNSTEKAKKLTNFFQNRKKRIFYAKIYEYTHSFV